MTTTSVAIHFDPGSDPEECEKRLHASVFEFLPSYTKFKVIHLFPDSDSAALSVMYMVDVENYSAVDSFCAQLRGVLGVKAVQVSATRSPA